MTGDKQQKVLDLNKDKNNDSNNKKDEADPNDDDGNLFISLIHMQNIILFR